MFFGGEEEEQEEEEEDKDKEKKKKEVFKKDYEVQRGFVDNYDNYLIKQVFKYVGINYDQCSDLLFRNFYV